MLFICAPEGFVTVTTDLAPSTFPGTAGILPVTVHSEKHWLSAVAQWHRPQQGSSLVRRVKTQHAFVEGNLAFPLSDVVFLHIHIPSLLRVHTPALFVRTALWECAGTWSCPSGVCESSCHSSHPSCSITGPITSVTQPRFYFSAFMYSKIKGTGELSLHFLSSLPHPL